MGLDVVGIEANVACDGGCGHPEDGAGRIQVVPFDVINEVLGDDADGSALPGVVPESPTSGFLGGFQEPGIHPPLPQGRHQQSKAHRIPIGKEEGLSFEAGHPLFEPQLSGNSPGYRHVSGADTRAAVQYAGSASIHPHLLPFPNRPEVVLKDPN